jgi:hypothetical protein
MAEYNQNQKKGQVSNSRNDQDNCECTQATRWRCWARGFWGTDPVGAFNLRKDIKMTFFEKTRWIASTTFFRNFTCLFKVVSQSARTPVRTDDCVQSAILGNQECAAFSGSKLKINRRSDLGEIF